MRTKHVQAIRNSFLGLKLFEEPLRFENSVSLSEDESATFLSLGDMTSEATTDDAQAKEGEDTSVPNMNALTNTSAVTSNFGQYDDVDIFEDEEDYIAEAFHEEEHGKQCRYNLPSVPHVNY